MSFNPYRCKIDPRYDIAELLHNFETPQRIEQIDDGWQRTLDNGSSKHRALAERSKDSWEGDPCHSPAKAADRSAYRRFLVGQALRLHKKFGSSLAVNLIPPEWQKNVGNLHDFDAQRELRTLKRFLEREIPDQAILILCLDFTVNIDSRRPGKPAFQPHLHGVAFETEVAGMDKLRDRYEPSKTLGIERPVKVDKVNDPVRQISYILKMDFRRWKPTYDRKHPLEPMPKLLAHEQRELLLFLDQYSFSDLVLRHGVRRNGIKLKLS